MPRLRNVVGARDEIEKNRYCISEPTQNKGKWHEVFKNDAPIHVEIGMGKGKFLLRNALANPDINYIGIEMFSSVLVRALQRADLLKEEETGNFRFIRMDARELADVFEKGEIDKIYLNFSDPWPKERHAKRRLTSRLFLNLYENVLNTGSCVEFKTDNTDLFQFSLEEVKETGWILDYCTMDLYADTNALFYNTPTEYEEKFVKAGNKICKMVIHKG